MPCSSSSCPASARAPGGDGAEPAADRDPLDADLAELGDRRGAGQREDVDGEVDGVDEPAQVVGVLHPRRVQHVGTGGLVREQAGERVVEVVACRAGSSRSAR